MVLIPNCKCSKTVNALVANSCLFSVFWHLNMAWFDPRSFCFIISPQIPQLGFLCIKQSSWRNFTQASVEIETF